jgi:hypothetical protein
MAASTRVARSVVVCLLLGSCSSDPTSEIAEMCSARYEKGSAQEIACSAVVSCAFEHPLGAQMMISEDAIDFDKERAEFQSFQACFRQRTGDISDYAGT